MTGRQEYDRTKDRQRILGKYMIDIRTTVIQKHNMTDTSMDYRRHYRSDTNISFIYIEEDEKDGPTDINLT